MHLHPPQFHTSILREGTGEGWDKSPAFSWWREDGVEGEENPLFYCCLRPVILEHWTGSVQGLIEGFHPRLLSIHAFHQCSPSR